MVKVCQNQMKKKILRTILHIYILVKACIKKPKVKNTIIHVIPKKQWKILL